MGSDLFFACVVFGVIWVVCVFDGPITSLLSRLDKTDCENSDDTKS